MVAIFTGLGAGFQRGSATALGSAGLLGSSGLGRGGESVSLNAATGNLVVSRQDEFLIGRGPDIVMSRTYNSLGALNENGDNWRQSTDRRIFGFIGSLNTAGSSLKRVSEDGSEITYTWNGSYYATTDGGGAHDKVTYPGGSSFLWTDGDTGISETYTSYGPDNWRIVEQRDRDGNALTFGYSADKLTTVTTQDGSYTNYTWSGNDITSVQTYHSGGSFARTAYIYDSQHRLTRVQTDLTPTNGADSSFYDTNYSYYGSSNLISAIWQTDGSRIDIWYDGSSRVSQIVQQVAGGDTRTTGIGYGDGYTYIADPRGHGTYLYYDGVGQLTQITAPPAYTGAAAQTTSFLYDAAGNVTRVTDATGGQTNYVYDANGNVTRVTDSNGNITDRAYDGNNSLILETRTGAAGNGAARTLSTRYVYDSEQHLRYLISAEGRVTEYRYSAVGELLNTLEYSQHLYASQTIPGSYSQEWPNTVALTNFDSADFVRTIEMAGGLEALVFRKDQTAMTANGYTLGGQIGIVGGGPPSGFYSVTPGKTYGYSFDAFSDLSGMHLTGQIHFLNASGVVIQQDAWSVTSISAWQNVQASAVAPSGAAYARVALTIQRQGTNLADDHMVALRNVQFIGASAPTLAAMDAWRDGLGDRSLTKNFEYRYNARGNVSETVAWNYSTYYGDAASSDGYAHTLYSYDTSGRVLAKTTVGFLDEVFVYDGLGRLTASTDLDGGTTTFAFNDAATTTTVTTATGYTTLSTYNNAGELISQVDWGSSVQGGTRSKLYDKNGQVRRSTDATGVIGYYLYDKTGRKIADIGQAGEVVEYRYDQAGRIVATAHYTNALSAGQIATLNDPNGEIEIASIRPAAHVYDVWQWTVYDADGRAIETIMGDGSATQYQYDQAGRLVATLGYFNKLSSGQVQSFMAAAPASLVLPGANSHDVVIRTFYDRDGLILGSLNAEGNLSRIVYDGAGRKIQEIAYVNATAVGLRATGSFDQLLASITVDANKDISNRYIYDNQGNLRWTVDALNRVTEYLYWDGGGANYAIGLVWKTIVYTAPLPVQSIYDRNTMPSAVSYLAGNPTNRISYNVYNTRRQLTYTVDAANAVVGFTYDSSGLITKTTQYAATVNMGAMGAESQWSANLDAWAASNLTDARITRNYYAARGDVRYTIDAEGYATRQDYDAEARVILTYRYANRLTVNDSWTIGMVGSADKGSSANSSFEYDDFGRLTRSVDANGIQHVRWFYANGLQAWDIADYGGGSTNGAWTYSIYDQGGKKINELAFINEVWGASKTTSYGYDGLGNLTYVAQSNGAATNYTHDKVGRILTETNALGGVTSYEYDGLGRGLKVTDARGSVSYSYFDQAGRVTLSIDAEGYATQTSYTAFGEIASVTRRYTKTSGAGVGNPPGISGHSLDATTTFQYDKLGRVVQTTDAEGQYEQFTLNAFGEKTAVRNKLGGWTTNYFDKRGLLTHEYLPIASYTSSGALQASTVLNYFEYDSRGNRTKMFEAYGLAEQRITTYEYDPGDRVIRKTKQAQLVATATGAESWHTPFEQYTYDGRGNLIQVQDATYNKITYWHDKLNRITHTLSASGILTRNFYDNNGNVTETRTYADNVPLPAGAIGPPPTPVGSGDYRVTLFSYDALNRLIESRTPSIQTAEFSGSFAVSTQDLVTSYQYDARGNVIKVTDPNGRSVFSYYDKLGRKTAQIDEENYRTQWDYNSDGNVLHECRYANQAVGTPTTTWAPEPAVSGDDRVTEFAYDRMGRRTVETRDAVLVHDGNGNQTSVVSIIHYAYNGLGQVTQKTEASGDHLNYSYDAGGRLVSESREQFTDFNAQTVTPTTTYFYNGLDDLTMSQQAGATNAAARTTKYSYGANGLLASVEDAEGFIRSYSYDAAGRVTRERYNRVRAAGGATVTEAIGHEYDLEGHEIRQGLMTWTGSIWSRAGLDAVNTRYNAFGEVSERGLNIEFDIYGNVTSGAFVETFSYDKAGRLWRSTAGDGLWKYFMYDRNGNQTLAVASDGDNIANLSMNAVLGRWANAAAVGTTNSAGVVAIITLYNGRNLATFVREPQRELNSTASGADGRDLAVTLVQDLVTQRGYNAFGEVSYEINAGGSHIDYAYNTMGRLILTTSPSVNVTLGDGTTQYGVRPTESRYYDASGRLVASLDANGNLTRLSLLAGTGYSGAQALIVTVTTADGAVTRNRFDIHGDAREVVDQINRTTSQDFDRMGRLLHLYRPGLANQHFQYDGLGQRVRAWNNYLNPSDNPDGVAEKTTYDAQGRIIQSVAMGGDITTHDYVWGNEYGAAGIGTTGGWREITTYANGRQLFEYTDQFGRQVQKYDMSGRYSVPIYDLAGRIVQQTGGQTLVYSYFNTGKLESSSTFTGDYNTDNWARERTLYAYDASGNLTKQLFTRDSEYYHFEPGHWEPQPPVETTSGSYYPPDAWVEDQTFHTNTSETLTNATAVYDGLGRLTEWHEAGSTNQPGAHKYFKYDANGNIRNQQTSYYAYDADANPDTWSSQDHWYRYDALNRVVTTKGQLSGGQIVRGSTGTDFQYDLAGQRVASFFVSKQDIYTYTSGGQLFEVFSNNQISNGAMVKRSTYTYDAMGRLTRQWDYTTNGAGNTAFDHQLDYNAMGQVWHDNTATLRANSSITDYYWTTNDYGSGSAYALGSVVQATTQHSNYGNVDRTSVTTMTYDWWDGAQQSEVAFQFSTADPTLTHSTYAYKHVGGAAQLFWVSINEGTQRSVAYTNDQSGQVIYRQENPAGGGLGPRETFYRFAGKQMGYSGNNDSLNEDYATTIMFRQMSQGSGPFLNGGSTPMPEADFDQGVKLLNSYTGGSSTGGYTVRSGETLSSIAADMWGDSSLWYKLAEANGLVGSSTLIEGQSLIIPPGVFRSTHNASTFTPYDPASTIGDTTPGPVQPKPKKQKCGMFGQILLLVIAVAMTAWLGPMFGEGLRGWAMAGAVGSATSQTAGLAAGIQSRFSWNQVASSALSAGIDQGGVLDMATSGKPFSAAALGLAENAFTQTASIALGPQNKFDWAGFAAAGVSAGVGALVHGWTGAQPLRLDPSSVNIGANLLTRTASAVADAATRSLYDGSDFDKNLRAALPGVIGSTIGEAIGKRIATEIDLSRKSYLANLAAGAAALPGGSIRYDAQWAPNDNARIFQEGLADAKRETAEEVEVIGRKETSWWDPFTNTLSAVWGGVKFTAGVGAGFVTDTVMGVASVVDFVVRDTGGSGFFWVQEGINWLLPGKQYNPFRQSWADFANASVTVGTFARRTWSGEIWGDIGTAFTQAAAASNNHDDAFMRGFTNPTWKVITGIVTAPALLTKGKIVTDVANVVHDIGKTVGRITGTTRAMAAIDKVLDVRLLDGRSLWEEEIIKVRGGAWEDFDVARTGYTQTPDRFPVFDQVDRATGIVVSNKTLRASDLFYSRLDNPSAIYAKIEGFINAAADFHEEAVGNFRIHESDISERRLHLLLPAGETIFEHQSDQLASAAKYAQDRKIIFQLEYAH